MSDLQKIITITESNNCLVKSNYFKVTTQQYLVTGEK